MSKRRTLTQFKKKALRNSGIRREYDKLDTVYELTCWLVKKRIE